VAKAKVAVTLDTELLGDVDRWVAAGEFPSRSGAVEAALAELRRARARRQTLLSALEKLDPDEERALAEEVLAAEVPWPKY
jgi:Arc/MetJ-type ribon-helix-helix transcriptional regulator